MASPSVAQLFGNCEKFLCGDHGFSVRDRALAIAASPLSEIGNDGYGRGGVVGLLEDRCRGLFGKEGAVMMPSGTMAQQIALRYWCDQAASNRVAFHPTCHLEIHEHLAYRELHHLEAALLGEPDRLFTLADLQACDPLPAVVLIELPQREIGGQLPSWEELVELCEWCRGKGIRTHVDGARIWECTPFYGRTLAEISELFDSVYASFYKVLNALPGAILVGPAPLIGQAKIWQRRHGGNLQQQSMNAISAMLALDSRLSRIPAYVDAAREVAEVLTEFDRITLNPPIPPTNMMHIKLAGDPERLTEAARQIMQEDRVSLFLGLRSGRFEFWAGDATLDFTSDEIRSLFEKLFRLAS